MVPQSPHLWTPEASVSPWMYNQDEYTYWIGRALVLIIWPVDVCNNGRRIQLKAPWNFLLSDKLVNQKQYCIPNRSTKWQRPKHIDRSDVIYFKPIYLTSLYSFLLKKQKKNQAWQIIASNIHLTRCYFKLQLLFQMCNFTGTDLYSL